MNENSCSLLMVAFFVLRLFVVGVADDVEKRWDSGGGDGLFCTRWKRRREGSLLRRRANGCETYMEFSWSSLSAGRRNSMCRKRRVRHTSKLDLCLELDMRTQTGIVCRHTGRVGKRCVVLEMLCSGVSQSTAL